MAYVFYTGPVVPGGATDGLDYVDAMSLLQNLSDSCLGRFYIDEEGNATYESRYALLAE